MKLGILNNKKIIYKKKLLIYNRKQLTWKIYLKIQYFNKKRKLKKYNLLIKQLKTNNFIKISVKRFKIKKINLIRISKIL